MNENDVYDFIKEHCDTRPAPYPEIRVSCPRCGDSKKFKLYINVRKKVWDCKVCGYGSSDRNIAALLSDISGIPSSEIDTKFGNITPVATSSFMDSMSSALNEPSVRDIYAEIEHRIKSAPKKIVENIQSETIKNGSTTHKYLLSRGIDASAIKQFKIRQTAQVHNFKGEFVLFTMRDAEGEDAFQARRADGGHPKYISSRNINKCLYPDLQVNHDLIRSRKAVVLVEGIFDALGCVLNGYGAYCAFGNTLTNDQIKILKVDLSEDTEIILAFDADLPTRQKVAKLVRVLGSHFKKISVVDTSKNPRSSDEKVDFGDVLKDKSLIPWLHDAIEKRFSVESSNYFKWVLETKIIEGVSNEQIYSSTNRSFAHDR